MLLFGNLADALHHLCSYNLNSPRTITVDDSEDLRGPDDALLAGNLQNSQFEYVDQCVREYFDLHMYLVTPWFSGTTPGSSTLLPRL